jgi:hypothetical protein
VNKGAWKRENKARKAEARIPVPSVDEVLTKPIRVKSSSRDPGDLTVVFSRTGRPMAMANRPWTPSRSPP